ncbi:restriction endonuclease subunit S [Phocaeicola massiliensis]|uniref:restriction endonuclease subunit S n=1 Tax=Phocaeicola massiliensis TaxID=204516 RepID=UPI000E3F13BD|nr:restriction endonuclease subunit S [Phocaeicola massiliensis]RGF18833.1 restriction endonuclease subunit S [Bacteroides sp. AM16-15]
MATDNKNKVLNVPHLRFPEFGGEWRKYKLAEICSFFSGGTPSSSKKEYYDGNIPFIRSGELHMDKTELFITEVGLDNSAAKIVDVGDLLLALYGATSGDIAISQIKGAINQAILCIRTTQNKKFIESVWKKHVEKLLQTYLQGGQGNLSADIVKNISFYFAESNEQIKLAKFITLLDERIATQNKIIEDLKKLKSVISKSIFSLIEDGKSMLLGDVAHISNGCGDVQDADTIKREGWYPFFDRSEEQKWFPTYSIDKEAIIYAGEGQSFYPRYYKGKFALHQRCYAITDFSEILSPKYCYYFMGTLNSYFIRNAVGSTVPSLRIDMFQKVKLRIPSIKRQKDIVSMFDMLNMKCENETSIMVLFKEQKFHLLQQMFI